MRRKELYLQEKIIGRHYSTKNFRVIERNKVFERSNSKEIHGFEERILQLNNERCRIAAARNKLTQNRAMFNLTGKLIKQMHECIDESHPGRMTETVMQACNDNLPYRGRSLSEHQQSAPASPHTERNVLRKRWAWDNSSHCHDVGAHNKDDISVASLSPRIARSNKACSNTEVSSSPKTARTCLMHRGSSTNELLLKGKSTNSTAADHVCQNRLKIAMMTTHEPMQHPFSHHPTLSELGDREKKRVRFADETSKTNAANGKDFSAKQITTEDSFRDVNHKASSEDENEEANNDSQERDEYKEDKQFDTGSSLPVLPKSVAQKQQEQSIEEAGINLPRIVERRRQSLINITEINDMVRVRKDNSIELNLWGK